jgi:hypothetical protein
MFFIGSGADEMTDEHERYVAGRYRNGSRSDIWTDVTRCAEYTFIAYLPVGATGVCSTGSEPGKPNRPPGSTVGHGCGPVGWASIAATAALASRRSGKVRPTTRSRPRWS